MAVPLRNIGAVTWARDRLGRVDAWGERPLTGMDSLIALKAMGGDGYRLFACHANGTVSRHVDTFEDLDTAAAMIEIVRQTRVLERAVWETVATKWRADGNKGRSARPSDFRMFLKRMVR